MTRKLTSVLLLLLLAACGTKKRTTASDRPTITVDATEKMHKEDLPKEDVPDNAEMAGDSGYATTPEKIDEIINTALGFSGVRYRYGGTTDKGMDCSGLLYVAFKAHDVELPRVSHQMAEEGRRIRVEKVARGDLLFFTTTRRGRKINHVGLVVAVEGDEIRFIHSTSSRGVIVSSLREGFWNYSFVKAARVL